MGCNCGKSKTVKENFVFVSPDGKRTTYKSEIEARAAKIRSGGGSYQAVPVR